MFPVSIGRGPGQPREGFRRVNVNGNILLIGKDGKVQQ